MKYQTPTAHVAARVVLVQLPDNGKGGCWSPRKGFEGRAYDRFPDTLKSIEGPFVNGVVAFTWEGDSAGDDELSARSAEIVYGELSACGGPRQEHGATP
jgi:hypothetical protein